MFTKHAKYRLSLRGSREMVATYLGKDYTNRLQFDLRPVGGTQTLVPGDILRAEPVHGEAHSIKEVS